MLAVWFVVGLGWSLVQTPAGRVVNRSSSESDRPAHFSAQFALSHGCWPIPWLGFFERDRVKRIGKPVKLRIANRINHRVSRRKAFRRQSVALGIKEVTTAPRSRWQNAYAERLASSGWYSAQSTVVSDAFLIEFPDDYLYMYRGYTDKDYRGARLHGFGMAEAARIAQRQGKRGLIGLVEAQNHASVRSARRIGYKTHGTLFEFRFSGRWRSAATPGCRRVGCQLVRRN